MSMSYVYYMVYWSNVP